MNDPVTVEPSNSSQQAPQTGPCCSWLTGLLGTLVMGLLVAMWFGFRSAGPPEIADGIPVPPESTATRWTRVTVQPTVELSAKDLPVAGIISECFLLSLGDADFGMQNVVQTGGWPKPSKKL